MKRLIPNRALALGAFAAVLLTAPGLALGQDSPVKGMILSHDGSTVVMRSGAGETKVTLTDATEIRGTSGALGVRGEDHPPTDLIRGLAIEVTTGPDGTAQKVTFKNSDLKTAQQIAAGISTTEDRVTENSDRIDNVGELMAVGRTKVFFGTGSSTLTPKGKQDLQALAEQVKTIKGYRLVLVGRADTTGNVAANQRLSQARVEAVKAYLTKSVGIAPPRILPLAALGDSPIAQDPDPPKNNDEARRVTITIAVSKSSRQQ